MEKEHNIDPELLEQLGMDAEDVKGHIKDLVDRNFNRIHSPTVGDIKRIKGSAELKYREETTRPTYQANVEFYAPEGDQRSMKIIIQKTDDIIGIKQEYQLLNNIENKIYSFTRTGKPTALFPKYLTLAKHVPNPFEKKDFATIEGIAHMTLTDKLSITKAEFPDVACGFDPLMLLHEHFAYYGRTKIEKIFPKRMLVNEKTREDYYTREFFEGIMDFYNVPEKDKTAIEEKVRGIVRELFLPAELTTVIHDSTPFHNYIISLINPSTLKLGPRSIDLGFLGWPEAFNKYPSENRESTIEFYLHHGYHWRRNEISLEMPHLKSQIDSSLLKKSVYAGSLYTIYKTCKKYPGYKFESHERLEEIKSAINEQWGTLGKYGANAKELESRVYHYSTRMPDRKEDER